MRSLQPAQESGAPAFARLRLMVLIVSLSLCGVCDRAQAGDWPQILGPGRNGIAVDEPAVDRWPAGGPKPRWEFPVGDGFAGPAVAGGKVIVFHRVDDPKSGAQERAQCLDAQSGKSLWQTDFPTSYRGSISNDHGPRCVPLIDRETVYLFGAGGGLHAVSLAEGKKLWSRETAKEFAAPSGYFGAGSTPLLVGDHLIVNVGGRIGQGVVAFHRSTGKTVWASSDEQASYSAPIVAQVGNQPQVIMITRLNCVGLDPLKGRIAWSLPFGNRGPTVNAATPLVSGEHLFLSASYGIGARWIDLSQQPPKVEWENDTTMSSQYSTSVLLDGAMYGVHGRDDVGDAELRCFDPRTGKVHWSQAGFGVATLILTQKTLLALKTDGTLELVQAVPDKYQPLGSASVFSSTTRALPALSNGVLFARDTERLKAIDLLPSR